MPTAPTVRAGYRSWNGTTANVLAGLKPLNYGDRIWKYYRDRYPTASIVMNVSKKPSISAKFTNHTQDAVPHFITLSAAVVGTTATVDLHSTGAISATMQTRMGMNQAWMNVRTKETMLSGLTEATKATAMVRQFGGVPVQAMVAGDVLVRVNTAFPEGSLAPDAKSTMPVAHDFYAAEHSTTTELTNRLRATRMLIEPNLREEGIKDSRFEHLRGWKLSYFLGGMGLVQTTTTEQTGVKGVMEHAQTNRWSANGILTYNDLNSFIGDGVAPWNPHKTILMATSNRVISIISSWALENVHSSAEKMTKQWGVEIDTVVIVGGRKLALVNESFFDEDPTMQGWAFILSPKMSKWRPVVGNGIDGNTTLNRDIKKDNGYKGTKDEWFTFGGWEHGAERAYGFIDGIEY